MAKIEFLVPKILKWEGGFVNHPNDKGGATNKGITIGTCTYYRKLKGLPQPSVNDLKNISNEEWMDVLKTLYWDKWKADLINNQSIANLLVDWVWGSGSYGIKYPQQVLGVVADGIVGKKTLAAVNEYPDQKELFQKLWDRRKQHFESIAQHNPSQKVFLKGWLNRLNDYRYEE
ncbi:peptidoglycan domain protein [Dysgonomonas sp. 521]|uniref:glycoside hydrolase family 108 protein n=1 Tax=Dysgonomonas sp. 521 TaxID=2302932 RepID=UPI0013D16580|nr:glycosyl hydrolase 108 family protein [Dysgonomonas sp. 521]NDV93522.1 peptidoglycan domain protein [Dysgonomonas sp. 521]